jgi:PAS domain S-box-containing protein
MVLSIDPAADSFAAEFWRRTPRQPDSLAVEPGGAIDDRLFRRMADHLPVLCWMAAPDGYIIWYNQRWHDYCGSTPQAMEGWGWQAVHDPDVLPLVMERWQQSIARGKSFEMVFPLKGADGVFRPFLTRIVPMCSPEGEVCGWFGTNVEIGGQLKAESSLRRSEAQFAVLTDAMPQMVWSTLPDGYHDFFNAGWYSFTGVPQGSTDGEGWAGVFHPDDQAEAMRRWQHSLQTGEPYEVEYRLRRADGDWRWTLGRALPVRDRDGTIIRWIGTCTDIHDQKMVAEQNRHLSSELSHRIKNIFAVIGGLIGLSARRHPEAQGFARDISGRIAALGRAHDFARPHSEASRPRVGDTTLGGILAELLQPYQDAGTARVAMSGPDVRVDDRSATPLGLLIHELATNAAKYGALSTPDGRVQVDWETDGEMLRLWWSETGGPRIEAAPARTGFGSVLADLSVRDQLDGTLRRDWAEDGLVLEADIPIRRLTRAQGE